MPVAFIDANAHRDITAADIAAASFVTVRAVQLAFRRHLDTTPMAYLRRTRLNGAHHDLIAAAPGSTTVTDIAARWGFFRPSRFAEHYRTVYGTSPSHTLNTRGRSHRPLRCRSSAVPLVGADMAGVTLLNRRTVEIAGTTCDTAECADRLQLETGEGPSVDAAHDPTARHGFAVHGIAAEGRWPLWCEQISTRLRGESSAEGDPGLVGWP